MDYSTGAAPRALDAEQLKAISALCVQAQEHDKEIEKLQARIAELEAKRDKIIKDQLPEMITGAGVATIELLDGTKVEVEDDLRASISTGKRGTPDNRPHAFAWLRKHGFGSLIKMDVVATFGMGKEKEAAKLAESLMKKKYEVSVEESVHPSTLKSFVKEQLALAAKPVKKGQKKPPELPQSITYVSLPLAKITPPSKAKARDDKPF